jgi:hypothetical protein
MTSRGPEDRERFAQRSSEPGALRPASRPDLESERSAKVVAGGSLTEALCAAGVVVLAIIGLAGALPGYIASIASIVLGIAFIAHGGAIAARFRQLIHETTPYEWNTRTELGGGMGAELIGGIVGIVFGILGLIGVATAVLIPIAMIVFGGALLLGSPSTIDLANISAPSVHERAAHFAREASEAASGTQALAGVGAVVLGILALVGVSPVVLALVALLVLGSSMLLSATATSTRMISTFRR